MSRHREISTGARWKPAAFAATAGALVVLIVVAVVLLARGGSSGRHVAAGSATPTLRPASQSPKTSPTPSPTRSATTSPQHKRTPSRTPSPRTSSRTAVAAPTGSALPLDDPTGSATQVLTVVAASTGSTTGVLQAWDRVSGGWVRHGPSIPADLGSDGLSTHPSESISATPIGSFTLTQAFGADANPGSALPYVQTTPADWWISQSGPLYNTMQRCSSDCSFVQGNPNEHLYYETPAYDYAVVIDYNTADAGPIVQGAGSAFFLHVSDGTATAGCVSIPQDQLVSIMRWLRPGDHPRILIGLSGS